MEWEYDMRHHTTDLAKIEQQVLQWRESGLVSQWYISDEPDGAGETPQ